MKYLLLFIFIALSSLVGYAQDTSSSEVKTPKPPLKLLSFADPHNPTKASIYSAVLPGLGQVYNQKYWKVPVIYASMGTATYFMLTQRQIMRDSNASFRALAAANKSPDAFAIKARDNARRYRDFAIISISAIYVLQIVDATVDAHFYKLNIDQDLEAKFNPTPTRFCTLTYRF
ncbi:MAG: hypothetical protein IT244_09590 [Bacteroidia bacterium]|nr:hypothetical protein [Bacteroidia bacterium]